LGQQLIISYLKSIHLLGRRSGFMPRKC